MAKEKKHQRSVLSTSLLPFADTLVQHRYAPLAFAVSYVVIMLWVALKYHVVGDYGVETDFYWSYVPQARHILQGTIPIEDFHGPAYSILLALTGLVTKDLFHAGVVLSVLAGGVALYAVYHIVRTLVRADVAAMTVLLMAVNTTFIQYSYTAGTDMVFLALLMFATMLLFRSAERHWGHLIGAAVLFGVAYLARYNGIFALAGVPAYLLLLDPYRLSWKDRAITASVFVGAFLLTIAPWGITCLIQKGSFFYNRNYLNIAYEMFAKGRMGWDAYWYGASSQYQSLGQVILADPGVFVGTLATNVVDHILGDLGKLAGWQIGVPAVIGAVLSFRERPDRRLLGLYLIGLSFFGVLLLVFYGERFSLYLLPVYCVLALRAMTWPALATWRLWGMVQIGAVATYVMLVWGFSQSKAFNAENIDAGPVEVVQFGEWAEKNLPAPAPETIIVARKPHIAYYLGMRLQMFPTVATMDELMSELRKVNASYLYFGLMEAGMRPQFRSLLDPANAPAGLRPLVSTAAPPAVLYRVELSTP